MSLIGFAASGQKPREVRDIFRTFRPGLAAGQLGDLRQRSRELLSSLSGPVSRLRSSVGSALDDPAYGSIMKPNMVADFLEPVLVFYERNPDGSVPNRLVPLRLRRE